MRINPTFLEIILFLVIGLLIHIWTKYERRIRRWWEELRRQRRGLRKLKPRSPGDCPLCASRICWLHRRPRRDILPWPEVRSPRGRRKSIDTNGYACLNPSCDYYGITDACVHALVSEGKRGKHRTIRYFKCQACGRRRTSRLSTPMYQIKTPLERVVQVMTALSEGVDISAATRIFGHHHTTISRWLRRAGEHSARLHRRLFFQMLVVGHIQLDELVTKVKNDARRVWVWTAVAARSKLIIAVHVGGRAIADAASLIHQVWESLAPGCLPIFTSDGLNQYFYGLTAHFGYWHKPPRARKHHWFPDERLQYAQLRKARAGRRVRFLYSIIRLGSRDVIHATLCALGFSGRIQTAFVERANLTLRELIAPLSRRTWSIAYDQYHLMAAYPVGIGLLSSRPASSSPTGSCARSQLLPVSHSGHGRRPDRAAVVGERDIAQPDPGERVARPLSGCFGLDR